MNPPETIYNIPLFLHYISAVLNGRNNPILNFYNITNKIYFVILNQNAITISNSVY